MSKGLGSNQQELLKHLTSEWQSTAEIAASYDISPADKTEYRSMIRSLEGLHRAQGRLLKEHRISNGRAISMWRMARVPAPSSGRDTSGPSNATTKPAHASKKPSKSVPTKSAKRADTIIRSKA